MTEEKRTGSKKFWFKDFKWTSLGWDLALPIFGGLLLGYYIDRVSATGYRYTLILLGLGVVTGYVNLFRVIELEWLRTKAAKLRKEKGNRSRS
jgi:F0F1-type ATP synthase assembly protein I